MQLFNFLCVFVNHPLKTSLITVNKNIVYIQRVKTYPKHVLLTQVCICLPKNPVAVSSGYDQDRFQPLNVNKNVFINLQQADIKYFRYSKRSQKRQSL